MAVIGPASPSARTAHRPARQHPDSQVHRHRPPVRAHRRRVVQDGVDVLLEHGGQRAIVRHRRAQRRRVLLAQRKALRGLGPEHDRDLQYLQHAEADAAPLLLGSAAEYADYYERALYNHILSSQNPETGMMCYYVPLTSGSQKVYNGPLDGFWCCTGTGVENHAKYGDSIYFHDAESRRSTSTSSSPPSWTGRKMALNLRQETRYPDEQGSRITLACRQPVEFTIDLRHPWWAASGFVVRINGRPQPTESKPGSFVALRRTWKTGDAIEISMPFALLRKGSAITRGASPSSTGLWSCARRSIPANPCPSSCATKANCCRA